VQRAACLRVAEMGVEADSLVIGPEADGADTEVGGFLLDPLDQTAPKARAADTGVEPDDTQGHTARVPPEGQRTADQTATILDDQHEEFIRAWEAGQFDAVPERPEVVHVLMLRPLGR